MQLDFYPLWERERLTPCLTSVCVGKLDDEVHQSSNLMFWQIIFPDKTEVSFRAVFVSFTLREISFVCDLNCFHLFSSTNQRSFVRLEFELDLKCKH